MNKSNDTTKTDFQAGSQISARQRIALGSLALLRRIVIACVAIEFVAIAATVIGVTPMVFGRKQITLDGRRQSACDESFSFVLSSTS